MATARCYTKSGNVEKYELNCFSGVFNHYPINFYHNIIGPDSNGNYTVTPPEGYEDSNTSTEFGCTTDYGGIKKTFYFKKKGKTITKYVISIINGPSYDYDDSNYTITDDTEQGEIYIYIRL